MYLLNINIFNKYVLKLVCIIKFIKLENHN